MTDNVAHYHYVIVSLDGCEPELVTGAYDTITQASEIETLLDATVKGSHVICTMHRLKTSTDRKQLPVGGIMQHAFTEIREKVIQDCRQMGCDCDPIVELTPAGIVTSHSDQCALVGSPEPADDANEVSKDTKGQESDE